MSFFYILLALLMLGVLVTVHEAGHFFAARLTGIPVKEFAIGFGPRLLSWKSKKHETRFFLRLILVGGYCMFYGEDDTEGTEAASDPRAIGNYPMWRRLVTVFMGPGMNFILALIVAMMIYGALGMDTDGYFDYPQVQTVNTGSPAEAAGIMPGDQITAVNGQDAIGITEDGTALAVTGLINQYQPEGEPLEITLLREGKTLETHIEPVFNAQEGRYLMGITLSTGYVPVYTPVTVWQAAQLGSDYCVRAGGAILGALKDLVTTGKGFEQSSGPVGIVQLIAEETERSAETSQTAAWLTYAELLVLISVNLGLFNLLPIPGLDGSRIVFLLIEGIRRKPVPRRVEAYIHMGGFVLLMGLMLVMTFKDIWHIFQ